MGASMALAAIAITVGWMDPAASREPTPARAPLRYVALGDSYTIGTATRRTEDRWPNQLVERLRAGAGAAGPGLELVANFGVNGYTSGDVIESELPRLAAFRPDFATILVGVNDVVQGVPEGTYARNVAKILDGMLAVLPADRILAVGTPDYTVTPQGAAYGDPTIQAAAIRRNNEILRDLAAERGIAFVEIYDVSLGAVDHRSLVADDGLHPSGAQYTLWADRIAPVVEGLLAR